VPRDRIATLAAHIHAATQRLLELIAEFDARWGGNPADTEGAQSGGPPAPGTEAESNGSAASDGKAVSNSRIASEGESGALHRRKPRCPVFIDLHGGVHFEGWMRSIVADCDRGGALHGPRRLHVPDASNASLVPEKLACGFRAVRQGRGHRTGRDSALS